MHTLNLVNIMIKKDGHINVGFGRSIESVKSLSITGVRTRVERRASFYRSNMRGADFCDPP